MIPEEKIQEIREHLLQAERPLFLHDDDPDGLTSFLVLHNFVKKKGERVTHSKGLALSHKLRKAGESFVYRVKTYNPDVIIILDVPVISEEFLAQLPCKVIHLDHHKPLGIKRKDYHYYNPRIWDDKNNKPTSYWSYLIAKDSFWIAMVGMIADWFVPEFIDEFRKQYPGLIAKDKNTPGEVYFDTNISPLVKAFSFIQKGKPEEVEENIKNLMEVEGPTDFFEQKSEAAKKVYAYYDKVNKEYEELLQDALTMHKELHKEKEEPVFIYTYTEKTNSFSSLLSTELAHRISDSIIIVARVKEGNTICSLRSREISIEPKLKQAIQGLDAHGGGHDLACGAGIANEDFPLFLERFKQLVNEDIN